jgi:hypothetical protein
MRECGVDGKHMISAAAGFAWRRWRCKNDRNVAHVAIKTTGVLIARRMAELGSVIVL